MTKKIIRFCYRKIIDTSSPGTWDKFVFESSYEEFLLQVQFYNKEKKYRSFVELLLNVPEATKLHFLVSSSVTGYLQQLNRQIPDIADNLEKQFMQFNGYKFEIINSDILDRSKHKVAIEFYSEPFFWHATIDNYLLVSSTTDDSKDGMLTHLVSLRSFLSIYSIQTEAL